MVAFASAKLANQCSFRHSSRNFPLKLSMYAFSTGVAPTDVGDLPSAFAFLDDRQDLPVRELAPFHRSS